MPLEKWLALFCSLLGCVAILLTLIFMKLSELAPFVVAVNAKLDKVIANQADPVIPDTAQQALNDLAAKATTLAPDQTTTP